MEKFFSILSPFSRSQKVRQSHLIAVIYTWEPLIFGNLGFGVLVLVLPLVTLLYSLIANTAQKNPNRAA